MLRTLFFISSITAIISGGIAAEALAQVKNFTPVTREMLLNPSPDDWLMFSRTYDNQRFSPLDQINGQNVDQLRMEWVRGIPPGVQEIIPIVQALDATNGDLLWEYRRTLPDDLSDFIANVGRARTVAIYEDLIFYSAPDGYVVALDARTGELRWEARVQDYTTGTQHTTGPIVVEGKVITGRSCVNERCFIVANDARTGQELWRFFTAPGPDEPGGDTWGNLPVEKRITSPWGLPGSYDPVRKLIYWGTANLKPHTRIKRHGENMDAIPLSTPAELYSNSTVALDPDTGKLVWYFQHIPGDDWDADHTQERILFRTTVEPDPRAVRWINPQIPHGQERDIVVSVGEPGGLWVLDRNQGQFLWTTPFPYDTPDFHISDIDVETGQTFINRELILRKDGEKHLICYYNTKGYWPMAYHPGKNSLYIPYFDVCVDRTGNLQSLNGHLRTSVPRPGSDPNALAGIAKVNMATGQIQRIYTAPVPGNGAILATAGDLIFWGDLNRRFRALDAESGKILWETILGGVIQTSTITYSVNGRQYVAVLTGDGTSGTSGPLGMLPEIHPPRGHNAIYVFALPEQR
jgi:alcohol dehydrogenase (cytochrome c)